MSEWTPERIAERRTLLTDPACLLDGKGLVLSLLDEIARLRSRLELDGFTDGAGKPVSNADGRLDAYDGIYCRDETIKLQDAEIERLQARLQSAQEAALKLGESIRATVARDQRRDTLLRKALDCLTIGAEPAWRRDLAARIRAELEGKP